MLLHFSRENKYYQIDCYCKVEFNCLLLPSHWALRFLSFSFVQVVLYGLVCKFFMFAVSEEGWGACSSREVVAGSDVSLGFGLWLFEPSLMEMCAI